MITEELDQRLQLHEHIEIFFHVDGYTATLYTNDRPILETEGLSIGEALAAMEEKAKELPGTIKGVRALPAI